MKARLAFYFAAVVALVLSLAAAVPSHATQHRDPALPQETQPASGAKPSDSDHASETAPAKSQQTFKKDKRVAKKNASALDKGTGKARKY